MNDTNTQVVLDELKQKLGINSIIQVPPSVTISGKGNYMEFKINSVLLNDIRFFSIWGTQSRNDFPSNVDMDIILGKI